MEVVCNNHSHALIYVGYPPRTGMFCGTCSHLVLSVLAALVVCVGYMWCLERTYVLAICIVGCLTCT